MIEQNLALPVDWQSHLGRPGWSWRKGTFYGLTKVNNCAGEVDQGITRGDGGIAWEPYFKCTKHILTECGRRKCASKGLGNDKSALLAPTKIESKYSKIQ